jgi:NADH:ubiquinone oxidoreductase subunit F (NADH-binding)
LNIIGNATTAAIADGGSAQYEQTELGGTALDGGSIVATMSGEVNSSGNITVTIYVAP